MTTPNITSKYTDIKMKLMFGEIRHKETQEFLTFIARYDKEERDFVKPIHILVKEFLDTIDKKFLLSRTYCKSILASKNTENVSYYFDDSLNTLLADVDINVRSYVDNLDLVRRNSCCIYGIQVLVSFEPNGKRVRNVGWERTLRDAYFSLLKNSSVLSEEVENKPFYKYALIEEIPFGLFGTDTNDDNSCLFFEYNTKKKRYVSIDTPESCKGIVGFIME